MLIEHTDSAAGVVTTRAATLEPFKADTASVNPLLHNLKSIDTNLVRLEIPGPRSDLFARPDVETMLHLTFSTANPDPSSTRLVYPASDLHAEGLHHCQLRAIFVWGFMPATRAILFKFRRSRDGQYSGRSDGIFGREKPPKPYEYLEYTIHLDLRPTPGPKGEAFSFRRFSVISAENTCQIDPPGESELKGWCLADLTALIWFSDVAWANDQFAIYTDEALFNPRWRRESELGKRCVRCLVAMLSNKGWVRMLVPSNFFTKAEINYLMHCSRLNEIFSETLSIPLPGGSPWSHLEVGKMAYDWKGTWQLLDIKSSTREVYTV